MLMTDFIVWNFFSEKLTVRVFGLSFSSKLGWALTFFFFLIKLALRKVELWFIWWIFFHLRLPLISINLLSGLAWNTIVIYVQGDTPSCNLGLLNKLQKLVYRTNDPILIDKLIGSPSASFVRLGPIVISGTSVWFEPGTNAIPMCYSLLWLSWIVC